MSNTNADKRAVLIGIVSAWGLSAAFIGAGMALQRRSGPLFVTSDSATVFAIAAAALTLVAGIGWAARTRHVVGHIGGSRPESGSALDLTLRYVTNTTEQLVLFALACLCLRLSDADFATRLLPVMGVWFALARAMFAVGYRLRPVLRATGFAATFHSTVALYALIILTLAD